MSSLERGNDQSVSYGSIGPQIFYWTTTSHIIFDSFALLLSFKSFRLSSNVFGANKFSFIDVPRKAVELGIETDIFQIKN